MMKRADIFNCLPTKLIEPREKPYSLIRQVLSDTQQPREHQQQPPETSTADAHRNAHLPYGYFQQGIFAEREDFGRQQCTNYSMYQRYMLYV